MHLWCRFWNSEAGWQLAVKILRFCHLAVKTVARANQPRKSQTILWFPNERKLTGVNWPPGRSSGTLNSADTWFWHSLWTRPWFWHMPVAVAVGWKVQVMGNWKIYVALKHFWFSTHFSNDSVFTCEDLLFDILWICEQCGSIYLFWLSIMPESMTTIWIPKLWLQLGQMRLPNCDEIY